MVMPKIDYEELAAIIPWWPLRWKRFMAIAGVIAVSALVWAVLWAFFWWAVYGLVLALVISVSYAVAGLFVRVWGDDPLD